MAASSTDSTPDRPIRAGVFGLPLPPIPWSLMWAQEHRQDHEKVDLTVPATRKFGNRYLLKSGERFYLYSPLTKAFIIRILPQKLQCSQCVYYG